MIVDEAADGEAVGLEVLGVEFCGFGGGEREVVLEVAFDGYGHLRGDLGVCGVCEWWGMLGRRESVLLE